MSKHTGNYYAKFKNLPLPIDYFTVGSFVVLSSLQSYDEPTGFPFRLAVFDPSMHQPRSDLVLDADLGSDNILRISVNVTQFERNLLFEQVVEGLEVFIKVCVRRGARGLLFELSLPNVSDQLRTTMQEWGFKPSKDEIFAKVVTPDILTRRFRFHDMEQIYQHPLDIPWNLVPLEYDAYMPLFYQEGQGRILDLGAGFGRNAVPLERHGFEVYGIDISTTAIHRCRQLVQRPQNYMVASTTALPYESDYFDFVLDVGCLHCMAAKERKEAVAEIRRVLKPEGLVYSRIFKPRSQEWLDVQPFYTSSFGLPPDEALALFTGYLRAHIWKEHTEMNYIVAQKENMR